MTLAIALAVNVGNVGRVNRPRRPMAEWIRAGNARLRRLGVPARLVGAYGHTGNFLVQHSVRNREALRRAVSAALKARCSVLTFHNLYLFMAGVSRLPSAQRRNGMRWTLGGVFLVEGRAKAGEVSDTKKARLRRMDNRAVLAWKRDAEDSRGRLDRMKRGGGWGAVSLEVARQVGGAWTARSRRTLVSIYRRALSATVLGGNAHG